MKKFVSFFFNFDNKIVLVHFVLETIYTYQLVQQAFKEKSDHIDQLFPILSVSRYLERIADHCTNIAEDVECFIEGRITRHNH